jgi:hypothetical protein
MPHRKKDKILIFRLTLFNNFVQKNVAVIMRGLSNLSVDVRFYVPVANSFHAPVEKTETPF